MSSDFAAVFDGIHAIQQADTPAQLEQAIQRTLDALLDACLPFLTVPGDAGRYAAQARELVRQAKPLTDAQQQAHLLRQAVQAIRQAKNALPAEA